MKQKKQGGMTIIEAMVAGTILAVILGIIMSAMQQIRQRQRYVATQQAQIWAVHHLVEQVKSMVATRPNATAAETMETALSTMKALVENDRDTNMPIVWSHRRVESSKDTATDNLKLCPLCKGRMGYRVVPLKNFTGYVLTIAISHPEIFMQKFDENKEASDIIVFKQFILGSS